MPRRKKNKRHRKGSRSEDIREQSCNISMATSLEEDLRQQRVRQHERGRMRDNEEEKKQMERKLNGKDCNDDVGFQPAMRFGKMHTTANSIARSNHLILKGALLPSSTIPLIKSSQNSDQSLSSLPSSVVRLPQSFLLAHVEQTSPLLSVQKRNTLRKLWSTQYQLETMNILPRAASLYSKTKWHQHCNSDIRCSWDLSCKRRLHSSARTLDVAMLGLDSTPTIATIFQNGWGLLRQKSHHKINTIKAPPAYTIRLHERSSLCGMVVRQTNTSHYATPSPYALRWYPLPHATSYVEAQLPRPVTDFCFGKEIALFACPRYSTFSSESLNPLFLPLAEAGNTNTDLRYYDSAVRTLNVQNFPQSDALRIEMMCEHQEKIVAFGHRNGQVSILDLRASGTVCSILQYEESSAAKDSQFSGSKPRLLGCVSDLCFLYGGNHRHFSSSGYRVLVRRSFGSCQLHDLRKTSTSNGNINVNSHTSTTVVRSMDVPPNEINSTVSANCNGFAVDPNSQQTLVMPYIGTPSDSAYLGVWSLETGQMVGSRLLLANHDHKNESVTLHVEVCSRTTPSLGPNGGTNGDNSSFGVWLKCGAITSGKLRSRVGSLHQIRIPGR